MLSGTKTVMKHKIGLLNLAEVISAYSEPSAPTIDDCIIDPDYPVEAYF
jgi:hypothetical protein